MLIKYEEKLRVFLISRGVPGYLHKISDTTLIMLKRTMYLATMFVVSAV